MLEALIEQEQELRRSPDELRSRVCPNSSTCSITDAVFFYLSVAALVGVFQVAASWCRWRFDHQIDDGDDYILVLLALIVVFVITFIAVTMICAMNRKAFALTPKQIRENINTYDIANQRPLKEVFPRSLDANTLENKVCMPRSTTLLKPARDIVLSEMRDNYSRNQKLLGQRVSTCVRERECMRGGGGE